MNFETELIKRKNVILMIILPREHIQWGRKNELEELSQRGKKVKMKRIEWKYFSLLNGLIYFHMNKTIIVKIRWVDVFKKNSFLRNDFLVRILDSMS